MDVAAIEPGKDFRKAIDQSVASCSVLLAMIGQDWLEKKDATGRRRLEDPQDFVRLELASALRRDIPVVPVLVRGAKMPLVEQLPEDLKELAFRNAVELTHARWKSDVQILVQALRPYLEEAGAGPDGPSRREPAAEPIQSTSAAAALHSGGRGDSSGEPRAGSLHRTDCGCSGSTGGAAGKDGDRAVREGGAGDSHGRGPGEVSEGLPKRGAELKADRFYRACRGGAHVGRRDSLRSCLRAVLPNKRIFGVDRVIMAMTRWLARDKHTAGQAGRGGSGYGCESVQLRRQRPGPHRAV